MAFPKSQSLGFRFFSRGILAALTLAGSMLFVTAPGVQAAPFPVLSDAFDTGAEANLHLVNCPPGYVANHGQCEPRGSERYRQYGNGYRGDGYRGDGYRGGGYYRRGGPGCPPGWVVNYGRCEPRGTERRRQYGF